MTAGGSGIRGGAAATLASSGVSDPVCVGTGGGSAESSGVWYITARARLAANYRQVRKSSISLKLMASKRTKLLAPDIPQPARADQRWPGLV